MYFYCLISGSSCEVRLEVLVDKTCVASLDASNHVLDDILVLHLTGGKDFFVSFNQTCNIYYKIVLFHCVQSYTFDTLLLILNMKLPILLEKFSLTESESCTTDILINLKIWVHFTSSCTCSYIFSVFLRFRNFCNTCK